MLPTNLGIMFESTPFGFPSNEMLLLKLENNIVKYYLWENFNFTYSANEKYI